MKLKPSIQRKIIDLIVKTFNEKTNFSDWKCYSPEGKMDRLELYSHDCNVYMYVIILNVEVFNKDIESLDLRFHDIHTCDNTYMKVTVDELFEILDCIKSLSYRSNSVALSPYISKDFSKIEHFTQLITFHDFSAENVDRALLERLDAAIKKGTVSIIPLKVMDKVDKKYRETLKSRDCIFVEDFVILLDNE